MQAEKKISAQISSHNVYATYHIFTKLFIVRQIYINTEM